MEKHGFVFLIERVREGDSSAWARLMDEYGPTVLNVARARLGSSRVLAILDAEDIKQSVMRSFYRRVSAGQFTLNEPAQLLGLLCAMARNKSVNRVRAEQRRPATAFDHGQFDDLPLPGPRPDESVAHREVVLQVLDRLNENERRLFRLRLDGHSWNAIADILGEKSDAVRKRLMRALEHIQAEQILGLVQTK